MKILAIDSSGLTATVAIVDDENLLAECTVKNKKTHSQTLLPMVDQAVTMCDMTPEDVDAIAVAKGPGSFTGLRIGAATAKGLALALNKPIIPVPTLLGLAYNMHGSGNIVCPIMDARRNQVYTAAYEFAGDDFAPIYAETAVDINELLEFLKSQEKAVTFVGDGIPVHRETITAVLGDKASFAPLHLSEQRASSVAAAAVKLFAVDATVNGDDFAPKYLRVSQAERVWAEQSR